MANSANVVPLIGLGLLLIFGAIVYMINKAGKNKNKVLQNIKQANSSMKNINASISNKITNKEPENKGKSPYKASPASKVNKEDVFNFMEFDKVLDNMIVSQKGQKYTAVIKCKGINYHLMSEVEQLSVESGFINFLNTLRFPIQLYVQAQNINLKEGINKFKANLENISKEYNQINEEYNAIVDSLESTDLEIMEIEANKEKANNVLEYGQDIIKYVEKLAINKNMLQRSFYVLVSYYKSELTNSGQFNKEELLDLCYSELFTRVQNIISGLAMSSITCKVVESNDLAELLYASYNRDDGNYITVKSALNSGYNRLYSTSIDAITRKNQMIVENMEIEAETLALEALSKAIEEGNIITDADVEDVYEEQITKMAINIVKNERVETEVKETAKGIIIDKYKKDKVNRQKNRIKEEEETIKKVDELKAKKEAGNKSNEDDSEIFEENKENIEKMEDMKNVEALIEQNTITVNEEDSKNDGSIV